VPSLPDARQDLNAWEKETLGLFLSSHPLKEVRAALRARADCGLSELADKRDGDWVTVGGMIAECKRIRTRKGEPMMFATLDDLEGQVEILVFNSAYAQNADLIDVDSVVLVRGRVDHKEGGETKLVVQEVAAFEPSPEEVASAAALAAPSPPPRLRLQLAASVPAAFLDELREVVGHFPGGHELVLEVGERTLVLGPDFRVTDSSAFRADVVTLAGGGLSVA
jgi:DNA polymerase-3 subunit alpha